MLKRFICPDGEEVEIKECLKNNGCRIGKRCLSHATLTKLGEAREWKGTPSTTQLIKGTMEAFLEITEDYAEDPNNMMFKLLGTTVHAGLEQYEFAGASMEGQLAYVTKDGISMIPDLLETEDDWNILTDYKVSGSYKIAKALGIYAVLEEGNETYKRKTKIIDPETGDQIERLKGQKKLVKVWKRNIQRQDCADWIKQVNYYRMGIEEKEGIHIHEMRIQAIVRDGGLQIATTRGLDKNAYLIPIPKVDDKTIRKYFISKRDTLWKVLQGKIKPEICNEDERWQNNKCERYCSVKQFCPHGKEEKWIKN